MEVRYEIRVQGFLGPALRNALANLRCQTVARDSIIRGRLSPSQLHAMLTRLDRYGVKLIRVDCEDAGVTGTPPEPAAQSDAEQAPAGSVTRAG
jgi:hypothetical protein